MSAIEEKLEADSGCEGPFSLQAGRDSCGGDEVSSIGRYGGGSPTWRERGGRKPCAGIGRQTEPFENACSLEPAGTSSKK